MSRTNGVGEFKASFELYKLTRLLLNLALLCSRCDNRFEFLCVPVAEEDTWRTSSRIQKAMKGEKGNNVVTDNRVGPCTSDLSNNGGQSESFYAIFYIFLRITKKIFK